MESRYSESEINNFLLDKWGYLNYHIQFLGNGSLKSELSTEIGSF